VTPAALSEEVPPGPVLVVGAGLIGASVGMALVRAGVKTYLEDSDPTAAHVAASRGAGSDEPAPEDVALVVVATPPDQLGPEIAHALTTYERAVVTDVGSVKMQPLAYLGTAGVVASRYVGGHPMAGSERSGPLASAADLFDGRAWAVVPHESSARTAIDTVRWLARSCGAVVTQMSARDHDEAVARISHLPHLVAALTAGQLSSAPPEHLALSGQGLRDVTRIAAGDPGLWRQIVSANAVPLTELLLAVRAGIDEVVDSLATGDQARLEAVLAAGVDGTAVIPGKHGGPAIELAEVTVTIPDEPGALARLFSDAGDAGVNIEDIRIDHDPARAFGLVEIDVSADSADRLVDALDARGWSAHR
jgi:prephenate dehydrogenase